jgi:oxalyl-CoA decarboxylase
VSGRPGGVYLDLPAKLLAQTLDTVKAQQSLVKVVDAAPRQLPAPESVKRAIDVLKSAKRPLILLGKGAAYAQADAEIRAFVEQSGIPYLPMSMAKGLLPDTHEQSASAARSFVLQEADVVVLIGARLNWLLSHGKGNTWGAAPKKFVQVDISPTEIDSNVAIAAPVIGDIGSCVAALRAGLDADFAKPGLEWTGAIAERKNRNLAKMAATLDKNPSPMNFHSALRAIRDVLKTRPDINVVNEGANTLDYARSIIDMAEPRKRFDSGTWGIMGIGMGFAIGAAVTTGKPVVAIEGDSAFGFSGMELETICRYDLPVCTVVFNNNGVYRGTDVNPTGGKDVAPTVFVKGARYDRMIEAFGGIGYHASTPEELTKALLEAITSGKPSLINAVIDEAAGTESGRLTNLNPQSAAMKK